jgi:(E)-4-hydroxy-3-methylbut-2-enyl-diphosphate synthase
MADADFGYVGAAPGKITLYKGTQIIERNIPQDEAVERLLKLIAENS